MARSLSLTFRGVVFRKDAMTIINAPEAPPFVRMKLRCDLSEPICSEMGWFCSHENGDTKFVGPSEGQTGGGLEGKIMGTSATFKPNSRGLAGMELAVGEASDFQFVPIKNNDKQVVGYELTFSLRSADPEAPSKVAHFITCVGSSKSQMKLSYTREAKQESLGLDGEEAEGAEDQPELAAEASE